MNLSNINITFIDSNILRIFSIINVNDCIDIISNNAIMFSITLGVFGLGLIAMSSGTRWVKMLINGVERFILVTAGGVVINDAFGNPIQLPGSGRGSGNNTNNPGNNTNNLGNNSGNNTGSGGNHGNNSSNCNSGKTGK